MAEVKVTKKDIQEAKRPDAVLEGATSAFDWLVERRTAVLGGLGVLLVVIAVATIATSRAQAGGREVGAKLADAVALTSRPVVEKKADAAVVPPVAGDEKEKSFPSKEAKDKAVQEALASVAKAHAGSPAGISASLGLAQAAYEAGRYDDAIAGYEGYLKDGDKDSLGLFAVEGLGYAYEAKGDLAKAQATFERLSAAGAPGRALYHKGRMLEKQGKKEDARKAYEDVVTSFEKEVVAGDARTRLELMDLPAPGTGNLEPAVAAPEEPAKNVKKPGKKPAPK